MGDTSNSDGDDRRAHHRKPLRGTAQLLVPGHAPLVVRTVDLSGCGLGVVAAANLAPKSHCVVQFDLPARPYGHTHIEVNAVVAQCIFSGDEDGFRVRLQFAGIPATVAPAFVKYLGD